MTHLMNEVHRVLQPGGHLFSLSSPSFLLNVHPPSPLPSALYPNGPHRTTPVAELDSLKVIRETYARALQTKRARLGAEEVDPAVHPFTGAGESGRGVSSVLEGLGRRGMRVRGQGEVGLTLGNGSGEGESSDIGSGEEG